MVILYLVVTLGLISELTVYKMVMGWGKRSSRFDKAFKELTKGN